MKRRDREMGRREDWRDDVGERIGEMREKRENWREYRGWGR